MKAIGCMVLMSLGACSALFSQATLAPVPNEWLRDGHLVVSEFNFSIDSPGPDPHWSYQLLPKNQGSEQTVFLAETSAEKYAVLVWEKASASEWAESDSAKKRFVSRMQDSLPEGWQVAGDPEMEQTTVPVKGSWKSRTKILRTEDGLAMYVYSYFINSKRTYILEVNSTATVEPPQFSRFVSSFALIVPGDNVTSNWTSILFILFVLCALFFGVIAPIWWFRATRKKHPYWKSRGWAFILGGVLVILAAAGSNNQPDPAHASQAAILGSSTGTLVLSTGAIWLATWGLRGKRTSPALPGTAAPTQQKSDTKTCPFCAETIQAEAIKCKHCGEFLNKSASEPDFLEKMREGYRL